VGEGVSLSDKVGNAAEDSEMVGTLDAEEEESVSVGAVTKTLGVEDSPIRVRVEGKSWLLESDKLKDAGGVAETDELSEADELSRADEDADDGEDELSETDNVSMEVEESAAEDEIPELRALLDDATTDDML
jgi:hypothetical protein